jgi:hypothetical protein
MVDTTEESKYRISNNEYRSQNSLSRNASARTVIHQFASSQSDNYFEIRYSLCNIRYSLLRIWRGIGAPCFMEAQLHLCPDSAAFYFQQFSLSKFAVLGRIWTAVNSKPLETILVVCWSSEAVKSAVLGARSRLSCHVCDRQVGDVDK